MYTQVREQGIASFCFLLHGGFEIFSIHLRNMFIICLSLNYNL